MTPTDAQRRRANDGVDQYLRERSFAGALGQRRAHKLLTLDLHPSDGRPYGSRIRRRAQRGAERDLRRNLNRIAINIGDPVSRRSRSFQFALSLHGRDIIIEQNVLTYAQDDFVRRLREQAAQVVHNYESNYLRRAKRETGNRTRNARKIERVIRVIFALIVALIPPLRGVLTAIATVTAGVRGALEILNQVVDALLKFFVEAAAACRQSRLLQRVANGLMRVKEMVDAVLGAYSATVARAADLLNKISDIPAWLSEVLAGTLAGRIFAAISDPIEFALSKIKGFIEAVKTQMIDVAIETSGAVFGAFACDVINSNRGMVIHNYRFVRHKLVA